MNKIKIEAAKIHKNSLVIDSLFPTFMRPVGYSENMINRADKMMREGNNLKSISAEMAEIFEGELYLNNSPFWQWWIKSGVNSIVTTVGGLESMTPSDAFSSTVQQIAGWTRRFDSLKKLLKVTSADDLLESFKNSRYGVILGLQNAISLDNDLSKLDILYNLGVRVIQLTYNLRNMIGDGCLERTDAGLSEFGIKVVKRMNSLGILIDLSHCGRQTTIDAIKASNAPVAFTHASCQAIYPHARGKSDEEMRILAENDGYMGILILPDFISEGKASCQTLVDHIKHAVDILGVDRVGIGTDYGTGADTSAMQILKRKERENEIRLHGRSWDGWEAHHWHEEMPIMEDYMDWRDFPNLTETLLKNGFSEKDTRKIIGKNFFRIFQNTVGSGG
tara:strand:+ start:2909 stop:4081 length:1173 start_codon:yes stop_codon:yes gene_type:complete